MENYAERIDDLEHDVAVVKAKLNAILIMVIAQLSLNMTVLAIIVSRL